MKINILAILMTMLLTEINLISMPLPKNRSNQHVVVVGAGLAGLTAAYRLQQAGYTVDVYEARERPGGRVYTHALGSSHVELGGQALEDGGDAKAIRKLIQEMGLTFETVWQQRVFSHFVLFDHQLEDISNLISKTPLANDKFWNQLQCFAQQSSHLGEVLDEVWKDKDPILKHYFELGMRGYEGSDPENLSVFYISSFFNLLKGCQIRAQLQAQGEKICLPLTHVKGGNSRLIEALEKALEKPIHYRSPLTKISYGPQGRIHLSFNSNQTISTDCLILALPCSTLRDVEIEENLFPSDQLEAIQTLQYGTNGKIVLPIHFSSAPPFEVCCSNECFSWFNHDYSGLILYYGGKKGILPKNKEDLQQLIADILPSIRIAYPEASFPSDIQALAISWKDEEFSKGSYSNLAPHQEKIFQRFIDIQGETLKSVFRPINEQIFFAGEHTSIDYPATLEGAVESGEKAARLICAFKSLDKNE